MKNYQELVVWQKSHTLVLKIYAVTQLPKPSRKLKFSGLLLKFAVPQFQFLLIEPKVQDYVLIMISGGFCLLPQVLPPNLTTI